MKTKIVTILLITMIVTEIIILHNQNTEVKDKNNKLLEELEENNLIINNQVNLNEVLYEKQKLEDETMLVFKEEKPEELFEKEKEVGNKLLEEINLLEDKIIGLESNLSELEKEYSRLLKEYETKNTFYITGVPFINQYPNYPTGCESVALTILLKYYGVSVTPDDVIEALQKEQYHIQKTELLMEEIQKVNSLVIHIV